MENAIRDRRRNGIRPVIDFNESRRDYSLSKSSFNHRIASLARFNLRFHGFDPVLIFFLFFQILLRGGFIFSETIERIVIIIITWHLFKKRFFYIGSKIGGVLYRYTRVLFFFVTMVGHAAAFNVTRTRYTFNTIAGVSLFSFIVQFLLIIFFFFFYKGIVYVYAL